MSPAHTTQSCGVMLALCSVAMPVLAQDEAAREITPVAIEAVVRGEVWPSSMIAHHGERSGLADTVAVVDYRLWLGAGRTSFGLGVAASLRQSPATGPWIVGVGVASPMLLGVRYRFTEHSRVYVDAASPPNHGPAAERDVRMGFEFKPPPSTALGLARGTLMRVQWSSHSQLSLRLRSGGLAVALKSQF